MKQLLHQLKDLLLYRQNSLATMGNLVLVAVTRNISPDSRTGSVIEDMPDIGIADGVALASDMA